MISPYPTRKETSYSDRIFLFSYILFIIIIGGILVLFIYVTRLASNEIFSPSNKIQREVGRAKDLSAPRYLTWPFKYILVYWCYQYCHCSYCYMFRCVRQNCEKPVRPHGTRPPPDGFSCNFMLESFFENLSRKFKFH